MKIPPIVFNATAEPKAAPFDLYREYINPELDTVTRIPGATIVAINSMDPHRGLVNGRVHRAQLEFVRRALEGVPEDELGAVASAAA